MNHFSTIPHRIVFFAIASLLVAASLANGQVNETAVGMKPAFTSETANDPAVQVGDKAVEDAAQIPAIANAATDTCWGPETILALAVIVFCLLVLYVQYRLVMKDTVDWTPNTIIRFFGLTLIINGGVLLVVAGFSSQQIAGVLGLLGSIAGYLLGASSKGSTDGDSRTISNSRTTSMSDNPDND